MASENKITNFYKSQKKTSADFFIPKNVKQMTAAEEFYRSCLKGCKKTSCINLKEKLNAQLRELNEKILHHEEAVKTCMSIIDDKDSEIEKLEKILCVEKSENAAQNSNESESALPSASTSSSTIVSVPNKNEGSSSLRFSDFANDFTSNQLADLRSIGLSAREDSSFIIAVMKAIYSDRLTTL